MCGQPVQSRPGPPRTDWTELVRPCQLCECVCIFFACVCEYVCIFFACVCVCACKLYVLYLATACQAQESGVEDYCTNLVLTPQLAWIK